MARSANVSVTNSFVKGLITEATGLNYPENSCTETFDCIFTKTGEVERRKSYDLKNSDVNLDPFTLDPLRDITDRAVSEYLWQSVALNGAVTFVVLQIGDTLFFYRVNTTQVVYSAEPFTVDISAFKVASAPSTRQTACSFTAGNGLLIVTHPFCDPFYVKYDEDQRDVITGAIHIKVRDLKGVPNIDTNGNVFPVDYRPLPEEMTSNAFYNLLNQGWYSIAPCQGGPPSAASNQSVLGFFYQEMPLAVQESVSPGRAPVYPAESEIWWIYNAPVIPQVDENGNVIAVGITPVEAFSRQEIASNAKFGSTTAPKGHYLLDAFFLDRAGVSLPDVEPINSAFYSGTAVTTSDVMGVSSGYQRPSQVAFYAGRAWYGGVNSNGFNTKIYFSQILDGEKNLDRCYQQQDPTSQNSNDLLATDGGVVEIPDIAQIVKLIPIANSLYVFATNGIWAISGSQGVGFTATDVSINRVSTTEAISATSFVMVEGTPIWWNTDGIWTFSGDNKVQSLTMNTIQTFFDNIPGAAKFYAKGAYNPFTKVVQWIYRTSDEPLPDDSGTLPDAQEHVKYSGVLNLDMNTGAFYPWTIPDSDVSLIKIVGIVALKGNIVDLLTANVTVNGTAVTVFNLGTDADIVTVIEPVRSILTSSVFKYITFNGTVADQFDDNGAPANAEVTFSETTDEGEFIDWNGVSEDEDGNPWDYTSYFVSGYKIRGDAIRKFQNNYLRFYTRNDQTVIGNSQFDFYGRWDFANTGNSGRWGQVQRVIITETDVDFATRRLKVRGNGLALNIKISSITEQPFNIIGWSAFETGNSAP